MNRSLADVRRLVVKIGSLLLVEPETGQLRHDWLDALAADVARCRARGQDVVIVSSGAIALGRSLIGLADGPLRLEDSQAAAAAGDALELMQSRKYRHLPVTEDGKCVGMVSIRDLYAAVKLALEEDIKETEAFVFRDRYGA